LEIDSKKLYIKRESDLPLVELRISEDQVCLKNNISNISKDRKDYILMKQ